MRGVSTLSALSFSRRDRAVSGAMSTMSWLLDAWRLSADEVAADDVDDAAGAAWVCGLDPVADGRVAQVEPEVLQAVGEPEGAVAAEVVGLVGLPAMHAWVVAIRFDH